MIGFSLDNIPFPDSDLTSQENNVELGRFFSVWGQIETTYGHIFRRFLQADPTISLILWERIGVREQLDILEEIFELIIDDQLKIEAGAAVKDVRLISQARNKIAHSRWGTIDGEAARFWVGVTLAHLGEIRNETAQGKAYKKRFIFTVTDLKQLVVQSTDVRNRLIKLLGSLMTTKGVADVLT